MIFFKVFDKKSLTSHTQSMINKMIPVNAKLEEVEGSVEIYGTSSYDLANALLQDVSEDEEIPSVRLTVINGRFEENEREEVSERQSEILYELGWDAPWISCIVINEEDGTMDWSVIHAEINYDGNSVFSYLTSYV